MFLAEVRSGQQCTSVVYGEMQHACSCTAYSQHQHEHDAEVSGLHCMLHFRNAELRMVTSKEICQSALAQLGWTLVHQAALSAMRTYKSL